MTGPRRYGTTVRSAPGASPGPAGPAVLTPPAAGAVLEQPAGVEAYAPPAGPVVYDVPGRRVSGPRTQGRPQPEYPREGYGAYRLLGELPDQASRWLKLVDWALGRPDWLLYIGITCRAGFVRWSEHSDTKSWAGDVVACEVIAREHWATLNDTVVDDSTGRPYLVFDVLATADDGIRPIKPGEAIDTDPTYRVVHGITVEVYTLDPVTGTIPAGELLEGARSGEKRLIQAWRLSGGPRPVHNVEHNEGDHAVHRTARRFPRLVALARKQALALVLVWLMLGIAVAQLAPVGPVGAALVAAGILQGAQVVRLTLTGLPPIRRRRRRPAGRKKRQRRRRARNR